MHKEEIWWSNLNLSSNNTPRIFVLSTKGIEILPIDVSRSLLFINEGLDLIEVKLKRIACVLDQFITSLLWTSQFEIRFKSTLSDSTKLLILLDESEAVESSAKRSRNDWRSRWHKSLIKIIKKRGPKTDTWGTPTFNASGLDLAPSKVVIQKRFDK